MTRKPKPTDLDYLPSRNGGADQIHNHLTFQPSEDTRESCAACAQLENDFAWLRFYDSVKASGEQFGTVEEAMAYARENMAEKADPRAVVIRAREYRDPLVGAA